MKPFGLYVHVPFCDGKCGYCAFYSVRYDQALADRYLAALEREVQLIGGDTDQGASLMPGGLPQVDTVYFGGGTPTVLSPGQIEHLCAIVCGSTGSRPFHAAPSAGGGCMAGEWTAEVNPGTITAEKLGILRSAGVNRISLGAQSFDDRILKYLGRRHTSFDTRVAVDLVRQAGFTNLGLDLITCIPGMDGSRWRRTLDEAVALRPEHVSVYALTVEEGTRLEAMEAGGRHRTPGDAAQLAALHLAERVLADAGLGRYEISNYAVPGFECRHNLGCWLGDEYIGIGPAASSHASDRRWTNGPDITVYLNELERGRPPPRELERLSGAVKATEMVIFGLRMSRGVDLSAVRGKSGIDVSQEKKLVELLRGLSESGLVTARNGRWILTDVGRDVADHVAVELIGWETEAPVPS